MKLLRHHGLARIGAQSWARLIEKARIVEPFGGRRDCVAQTNINLHGKAGRPEARLQQDPTPTVGIFLPYRLHVQGFGQEDHRVRLDRHRADLPENLSQGFIGELAKSQEVGIARWAKRLSQPGEHEERPFQDEPLPMRRARESIQEALQRVARERYIRVDPRAVRVLYEPCLHRLSQPAPRARHAIRASR